MEIEDFALRGQVAGRLSARFPHLGADQIWLTVSQAHQSFAGATVRLYLPVLVERRARQMLLDAGPRAKEELRVSAG